MTEKSKERPDGAPSGAFGGPAVERARAPAPPERPRSPAPPRSPQPERANYSPPPRNRIASERNRCAVDPLGRPRSSSSSQYGRAVDPNKAAPQPSAAGRLIGGGLQQPVTAPVTPGQRGGGLEPPPRRNSTPVGGSFKLAPGPRISFPPTSDFDNRGAEELVFEDDPHEEPTARGPMPTPLGQAEGHDAWTLDRMSRQSTVPPVRRDDFDRLRELSALPLGEAPAGGTRGGALDLVDRSRPLLPSDLVSEMEELYALDDLTGALRHAELILGRTPDNEQAQRCASNCRNRLIQLYSSKIGKLDRVVVLALGDSQLRWLGLDHRSGFLLSRVDGFSTLEELLDVCGMPRLEALKTLADLLERGAIRVQ